MLNSDLDSATNKQCHLNHLISGSTGQLTGWSLELHEKKCDNTLKTCKAPQRFAIYFKEMLQVGYILGEDAEGSGHLSVVRAVAQKLGGLHCHGAVLLPWAHL